MSTDAGVNVDDVLELARNPLQAELTTILESISFEDMTVYDITAVLTVVRPVYARVLIAREQQQKRGVRLVTESPTG